MKRIYYITVKKGDSSRIKPNFLRSEFFCKSGDTKEHKLATVLVDAAQVIRDYYNKPVSISSSFRTALTNRITGGAPKSLHLTGCALDLQIAHKASNDDLNIQFSERKGELFEKLRDLGITGFGVYGNSFVHIDCRRESDHVPMSESDSFGAFEFWDYGKKK